MAKRYCVKKKSSYKWEHVYAFKTRKAAEQYIREQKKEWEDDWEECPYEFMIVEEGREPWEEDTVSNMKLNNPQHPYCKKNGIKREWVSLSSIM